MSISYDRFHTYSTRHHPQGALLAHLLGIATAAADPQHQITRTLQRDGRRICVAGEWLTPRAVTLIAIGKAALPMAARAGAILGDLVHQGVVIYKDDDGSPRWPQLHYHAAGHPVPTQASITAGHLVRQTITHPAQSDLVLVLLSGGGSALMVDLAPGIHLSDMQILTEQLLASGASINEINTIRRRIDRLKGGGLLHLAGDTAVRTLVLSDVIGNDLATIASGPTVVSPDSPEAAWQVIQHYRLEHAIPASIAQALQRPQSISPPHAVTPHIIGDITQSITAVAQAATAHGYATVLGDATLHGDARVVGRQLGEILLTHQAPLQPLCFIAGGETTMTLTGTGRGGRNQELALAVAQIIVGTEGIIAAAYASDGGDGPTDAAGAVVTGESVVRAQLLGLDLAHTLRNNDSYTWWDALGDLLRPGATGTNVNDLFIALMMPKPH